MDLMTQSTSYKVLETKYRGFVPITFEVLVEGDNLKETKGTHISHLEVELTSEYPASSASFDIIGEYDPPNTDFNSKGAMKALELGAKVEVKLGYISTETVFNGLITEIAYHFPDTEAPYIHVECMDAKVVLMKTQRLEIRNETQITQAVSKLLGEQPVSSYLNGKKVETPAGSEEPLAINMNSDYEFIVRQAQYCGSEFFIVCGKAYFRNRPASGAPIMTLEPGKGLLSATFSIRGAELVEKVSVVGVDPLKDEAVTGSAKSSGSYGKGSTPKKMLSGTERVYLDPRARTKSEAQARADILIKGIGQSFGVLEAECIGLPDLVPGRLIKLKGLMDRAQNSYYITNVKHIMGQDGFFTNFEARIDSL